MSDNNQQQIQAAFAALCKENPPRAFVAVTVGEDLMVNFATMGLSDGGAIELLQHMLDYIKQKESDNEFGREDTTKIH
jgi:hypothetical protein